VFDPELVARWMPVGQYIGGAEHATLHLLYVRFFGKVLHDMGLANFSEPIPRLYNQGQVIFGGAAMSKSKGNVVEPMPLVERWGADTMRLTMLFAGPFEDDIDWKLIAPDPDRRPAMNAWLGRVFKVAQDAVAADSSEEPDELVRAMHRAIKGVTEDLERYRFNTAISKLQVLSNDIRSALDGGAGAKGAAAALVQMLAPFAPFSAEELWSEVLGHAESVHRSSWPSFDPAMVVEDLATLVVQVNGKVRDTISVAADASEDLCRELAEASEKATRAIGGAAIAKVIVRPPKLVNFVTVR
jgi:leucyl-tRNA synthetase